MPHQKSLERMGVRTLQRCGHAEERQFTYLLTYSLEQKGVKTKRLHKSDAHIGSTTARLPLRTGKVTIVQLYRYTQCLLGAGRRACNEFGGGQSHVQRAALLFALPQQV